MSQLSEIQTAQKNLEEIFMKRMDELEAQIQGGGPAKDTVAKVAEEFRAFRELIFSMLNMLRMQINECFKLCDNIETRQRRKALIFSGIIETEKENGSEVIAAVMAEKLGMKDITSEVIKSAHRLGNASKDHQRPILVRFSDFQHKAAVWKAKSKFKGTSITIKEFLTKARQTVFSKARLHFGMRCCWTQDGVIIIKAPDGSRSKVTTTDELNSLMKKFPKTQGAAETSGGAQGVQLQ